MILADLVKFADFVPLAVFVACAATAWFFLEMTSGKKSRTDERLDELRNPRRRDPRDGLVSKKPDAMAKVLEKATPLAQPLAPKNEAELSKLRQRMAIAGFRGETAGTIFFALKLLCLLGGIAVVGCVLLATSGFGRKPLLTGAAVAGLLFYLPDVVVWFISRGRKEAIFLGLPDALDLMVVCVEAGLGLDQAMRKVAEEMKKSFPVIAQEFSLANFQFQMGRPRAEVLRELGERNGVADLRGLAAVMIQADRFGSSVAQALRVQSDAMRVRRRQLAEERAAKTAVELIFPLVLFIFPGIFVVLVGPAAIQMIRQYFTKMG